MRTVAIVGNASSCRYVLDEPANTEVWGCSATFRWLPLERIDRWFEMHSPGRGSMLEERHLYKDYWDFLRKLQCPLYMVAKHDLFPTSVTYPIHSVVSLLGPYFTNTIAYMIGLAIWEKADAIHIYGVDLHPESERQFEKPCVEYLLGFAKGRGIKIEIPEESSLLKAPYPLYGALYGPIPDGHVLCVPGAYGRIEANGQSSDLSKEAYRAER